MTHTKIVFLFAVFAAAAQLPKFEFQGKLQCNGQDIKGIGFPTMYVSDWDGDGKKDLLIGEFGPSNKIRFYKNTGSNTAPAFKSFSYLKANGVDINLSGG